MNFIHLNQNLRYQIAHLLAADRTPLAIANTLGFHQSTIYREIKHGKCNRKYDALLAQERSEKKSEKKCLQC